MPQSHKIVYAIYLFCWLLLAIAPQYRDDWLLENLLVFLLLPLVLWFDRRYGFTLFALVLLLIFSLLHAIGAHYTYAEMRHFDTITAFFGFERNHFDRVVHFLYGLLLYRPILEMVTVVIGKSRTALFFTFSLIISVAALYEILEWLAAAILHPELGVAFLGTQGDIWDAQKDTLVAIIGGFINLIYFLIRFQSDKVD
ncbi:MAG: DUF2238 domain-containing protein [Epsilonproteobacteria bacterium]|nr:DUF2238 domain-containing protein [Campylobacterota bacterium]